VYTKTANRSFHSEDCLCFEEVNSQASFQKSILTTKHAEIGAPSQETCTCDDIGRDKDGNNIEMTEP